MCFVPVLQSSSYSTLQLSYIILSIKSKFSKNVHHPVIWAQRVLHTWQHRGWDAEWWYVCLNWATQFSDCSSVQAERRKVKTAKSSNWLWSCSFQVSGCETTQHRSCDPGMLTQPEHAPKSELCSQTVTLSTTAKLQVWQATRFRFDIHIVLADWDNSLSTICIHLR